MPWRQPLPVQLLAGAPDPCDPTDCWLSSPVIFGDVNGDGTIDDGDLLAVLFNFGAGE
jgi:hypothetical protein